MPTIMRADSTEFLTATVTADHDVSAAGVQVALPAKDSAPATWYPADVVVTSQVSNRWVVTYRLLVGPAGGVTQLDPGDYDWTVKLTDNPGPEVPIRKAGVLTITAT